MKTTRHPFQQLDLAIRLAQQQHTALGARLRAIESRYYLSRKMRFKRERALVTLCHGKGRLLSAFTTSSTTQLCLRKRPFSTADQ